MEPRPVGDHDSRRWLRELRGEGAMRDQAIARLHALLLRAARFEVARRRGAGLDAREAAELAEEASHDALVAVLAHLDDFRGDSRFTTWAYKFALLEAGVKVRRRAWRGRELPGLDDRDGDGMPDAAPGPHETLEQREWLTELADAIGRVLTPHQREVFGLLALNGVPIDVLAERAGTTRGALYKTLHDARRKLRAELGRRGYAPSGRPST
ncbi:MAG: sigma-70 family RNA polymerase sigma factor [Thermoleophilia bacterium]